MRKKHRPREEAYDTAISSVASGGRWALALSLLKEVWLEGCPASSEATFCTESFPHIKRFQGPSFWGLACIFENVTFKVRARPEAWPKQVSSNLCLLTATALALRRVFELSIWEKGQNLGL